MSIKIYGLRSGRWNAIYRVFFTSDEFGAGMPPTTYAIEGQNSEMKRLLSSHNGLSKERKMKFIDYFLSHYGEDDLIG